MNHVIPVNMLYHITMLYLFIPRGITGGLGWKARDACHVSEDNEGGILGQSFSEC